jgi:hypothetical protein
MLRWWGRVSIAIPVLVSLVAAVHVVAVDARVAKDPWRVVAVTEAPAAWNGPHAVHVGTSGVRWPAVRVSGTSVGAAVFTSTGEVERFATDLLRLHLGTEKLVGQVRTAAAVTAFKRQSLIYVYRSYPQWCFQCSEELVSLRARYGYIRATIRRVDPCATCIVAGAMNHTFGVLAVAERSFTGPPKRIVVGVLPDRRPTP